MSASNRVYVISAPSGAGKTTLNRRLVAEHKSVALSVSYTTRARRPSEEAGVDYHYVTTERFRELIAQGQMLEYAEVFGTLYGTALAELERIRKSGCTPLLEIDVQGWRQAKAKLPDARSIFILPPTVESLWRRLEARATESKEVRWKRLMTARAEISSGSLYDEYVVNSDLELAYSELQAIIIKGKKGQISHADGVRRCQGLLDEFDSAPWLQKLSRELADK